MAKMKCQTRYQEEWKSFGTMNACGQNGFWKEVINFRKTSIITLKNMICLISFLKMTAHL